MVGEVAVNVLEAVVPEEDQVAALDLLKPLDAEVDHVVEVPRSMRVRKCTYFLPAGTCRGLMSALLKCAKTSSHGATS